MRPDGSVETSGTPGCEQRQPAGADGAAELHGAARRAEQLQRLFTATGLGNSTLQDSLTAFQPIVPGTIS